MATVEEIDSFIDQKCTSWKCDKKIGQGPPPSFGQNPKEQQYILRRTSLREPTPIYKNILVHPRRAMPTKRNHCYKAFKGTFLRLLWQPMKKGTCSINVKQCFLWRDYGPQVFTFWMTDWLLKTSLLSLHRIKTATGLQGPCFIRADKKEAHDTNLKRGWTSRSGALTPPQHHARGNSAFDTWHWMNRFQQQNILQNKLLVFPNNCTFI